MAYLMITMTMTAKSSVSNRNIKAMIGIMIDAESDVDDLGFCKM